MRLRVRAQSDRLNRARALGLIDENRANPARWKGHLDQLLPNPKKIGHFDARGGRADPGPPETIVIRIAIIAEACEVT